MKDTAPLYSAADASPASLRRFSKFVAFSTLFLIFAGAMVTSTDSGLSVPDWPNTYGKFMFAFPLRSMVGGIFYEHSHRMIAATVGFLTVVQAFWLQLREPKRFLRILGWCAVGAVIAQGVLGGLTVIFFLPHAISIAHAGLAEIFFCLNVSIAFFTSRWYVATKKLERSNAPVGMTTALVAIVYSQILLGAVMRHLHAGLAIPDFPLSFGRLIPHFTNAAVAVNFAHRIGAVCVAIAVVTTAIRLMRYEAGNPMRQLATLLLVVLTGQIFLGAYTIWSGKHPVIASLHVAGGASTLALSLLLALTARAAAWRTVRMRQAAAMLSEVAA